MEFFHYFQYNRKSTSFSRMFLYFLSDVEIRTKRDWWPKKKQTDKQTSIFFNKRTKKLPFRILREKAKDNQQPSRGIQRSRKKQKQTQKQKQKQKQTQTQKQTQKQKQTQTQKQGWKYYKRRLMKLRIQKTTRWKKLFELLAKLKRIPFVLKRERNGWWHANLERLFGWEEEQLVNGDISVRVIMNASPLTNCIKLSFVSFRHFETF